MATRFGFGQRKANGYVTMSKSLAIIRMKHSSMSAYLGYGSSGAFMGLVGCGKCARLLLGETPLDVLLHTSLGICIVQPVHARMKVASVLEFLWIRLGFERCSDPEERHTYGQVSTVLQHLSVLHCDDDHHLN